MTIERRGFVQKTSLGLFALVGAGRLPGPEARAEAQSLEPWLDGLTGRHRQYLDVAAHLQGASLGRAANFLNAYGDAYVLKDSDLNVVFGVHGTAPPIVLSDPMWSRFRLGEYFSINDPVTKGPSTRNIFSGQAPGGPGFEPSVATLQKRGVRFLACKLAIARLARELAARDGQDATSINQTLLAGLLPGVFPVPAAIVAVNRAQEAGLTYVYVG